MDHDPARFLFVTASIATLMIALAGCGDDGLGGDPEKGGGPEWQPRDATWTTESGTRLDGGDGSEKNWKHEAEIDSKDDLNSTSFNTIHDGAGYACRKIVIHLAESHPLLGIAAEQMIAEFQEVPGIEAVVALGRAGIPEPGSAQPDLDVWLELPAPVAVEEVDGGWRISADVRCRADTSGGISRWSADGIRDLVIPMHWDGTLQHRSKTELKQAEGISAPIFRLAGKTVGQQLAKPLVNEIVKLQEAHGPPPRIPEALRVSYSPTAQIPWPEGLVPRLRASYVSGLAPNRTSWALESKDDLGPLIEQLEAAMQADGWKTSHRHEASGMIAELTMSRGDEWFHFQPDLAKRPRIIVNPGSQPPPLIQRGIASYGINMTPEGLREGLGMIDLEAVDRTWLLLHARFLDAEQKERMLARLEAAPPGKWKVLMRLARLLHDAGRREEMMKTLRRAGALAWLTSEQSDFETQWKQNAEAWKLPEQAPSFPAIDDLVGVGAIRLEPGKPVERTVELGEALIVADERDGVLGTTLLRLDPRPPKLKTKDPHALFRRDRHGGTASWGTRPLFNGRVTSASALSGQRVGAVVERIQESPPRFKIILSLSR